MRFLVPTLFALAGSVAALGSAVVMNLSKETIYVWPVGSSVGPRQMVVSGQFMRPTPPCFFEQNVIT